MKKARRTEVSSGLNITSMMDMMTIILVFLLKSFSATDVQVTPSDDLTLPFSTTQKNPEIAVNVVVAKSKIIVDGKPILNLGTGDDPARPGQKTVIVPEEILKGQLISPLFDVLEQKAKEAKAIGERTGSDQLGFKGRILLQVDQNLPFSVLRTVMYTAGQAQFGEFKFVVYKME